MSTLARRIASEYVRACDLSIFQVHHNFQRVSLKSCCTMFPHYPCNKFSRINKKFYYHLAMTDTHIILPVRLDLGYGIKLWPEQYSRIKSNCSGQSLADLIEKTEEGYGRKVWKCLLEIPLTVFTTSAVKTSFIVTLNQIILN